MSPKPLTLSFSFPFSETMANTNTVYAVAQTAVFWDLEDCPIPDGLTPGAIYQNIRLALTNMGYIGGISITAFVDDTSLVSVDDFESAGIKLQFVHEEPEGKAQSRYSALTSEMLFGDLDNREPLNVMVIAEFISAGMTDSMIKRNNNVLLALPENAYAQITDDVSSVWFWTSLSVGGTPIDKPACCPDCLTFQGDADCTESSHTAQE